MEKRKIRIFAIAILAIGIAAALSGGMIYAWFSDTDSTPGNNFVAGKLDLTIGGEGAAPIDIDLVYPGWGVVGGPYESDTLSEATVVYIIKNVGDINGVLYFNIDHLVNNENGVADPENGVDTSTNDDEGELGEYLFVSIGVTVDGGTEVQKLIPTKVNGLPAAVALELADLGAGEEVTVTFHFSVPITVGNIIQSDSVTFDAVFTLEQDQVEAV